MHDAIQTVHTSGINWASVVTIVAASVGCMSIILGFMGRSLAHYVAGRVTTAIDRLRIDVIATLEERVSVLEATNVRKRRRRI